MTDTDDKNMLTIAGMSRETIAAKMVDAGMHPDDAKVKAGEHAHRSTVWLAWAGVAVVVMLGVVGLGLYLVVHVVMTGGTFPLLLAIIFAVAAGLPLLVAIFCATQADSEFMKTYLGNLFRIGRAIRGKDEPSTPAEPPAS